MELLQLEYFITLAECQHMTRAANALMISQPSLSNTLSRIEKELDVKLFDRQGRNIVLNAYGEILLQHAKNIFRELDNINTEIDALKQVQAHTISIGSVDSTYVKDWLPYFVNSHPDISIQHTIGSSKELESMLEKGEIDFAVTITPVNEGVYGSQLMGSDEFLILSPLSTALADDHPQDFINFINEPFLCTPKNDNILRSIDILSEAVDGTPNIVFEGEQVLLSRMFNFGYGNIITPKSNMLPLDRWDIYEGLFKIYFLNDAAAHFNVNLIWDAKRSLSDASKQLIDFVRNKTTQFQCVGEEIDDPLRALSVLHNTW